MELEIGGMKASQIAGQFGTPLYVYDQATLENRMETFKAAFSSPDFACHVAYASKAFCTVAMMQLVKEAGLYADVVSGGELYTALAAGMDPAHLIFHGNNKTAPELDLAFSSGIGWIVVDHADEVKSLKNFALKYPACKPNILIRINPGVEAHTHAYITTANPDSKFGIPAEQMDLVLAMTKELEAAGLPFAGFHAHIGSQIFDVNAFKTEVEKVAAFVSEFEAAGGPAVSALDFGGGFAARYTDADAPIPIETACATLIDTAKAMKEKYSLSYSTLFIEPGRSIAAEAGTMLYTVGAVKQTPAKRFAFVDGGMADNIRPALYQAEYEAAYAKDLDRQKDTTYTIAGKCCESGDILIEEARLPQLDCGDLLAVYTVGAYGWSMASRYNKLAVPPVVFVKDGKAKCVVKRQSWADLIENEVPL